MLCCLVAWSRSNAKWNALFGWRGESAQLRESIIEKQ
jgi:hypothetical protein